MSRQLAADTAVPSATYQPMQRLVAGDRIVIESGGRRHEVVVLDVQQRGDRIEYTTADPRYSARRSSSRPSATASAAVRLRCRTTRRPRSTRRCSPRMGSVSSTGSVTGCES
ncbi:hypothetical protein GS881_15615 [Rhodococcus hoagii]|nr:hypothetical protein [Prescottella equi]